jgi:hypothetical protein
VNQTRTKAAVRGAKVKSKPGRRPPVKVKSGPELPLLPIVVGGLLIVLAIVLIVIAVINSRNTGTGQPQAAGIPCDQLEHSQTHYHAAIQIVYGGIVHPIPANIGIVNPTAPTCYYWLHVHAADPNIIHIEAPRSRVFTLSDFFAVWSTWSGIKQQLDSTHVSTLTLTPDQKIVVYVDKGDGKGAQVYDGDPNKIVLLSHEVITIEITPPTVAPPPAFTFPTGL